jgi:hypothetical protein
MKFRLRLLAPAPGQTKLLDSIIIHITTTDQQLLNSKQVTEIGVLSKKNLENFTFFI